MIKGAIENQLPNDYIKFLQSFAHNNYNNSEDAT